MLHLVSVCLCCYKVPDPDLEIRGGGGEGGDRSQKVLSKNKGWARAPRPPSRDPPLLHHDVY